MNKQGTSEELGRIEFTGEYDWVIFDDGDPDAYIYLEIKRNGGTTERLHFYSEMRADLGDEEYIKTLENAGGDTYKSII